MLHPWKGWHQEGPWKGPYTHHGRRRTSAVDGQTAVSVRRPCDRPALPAAGFGHLSPARRRRRPTAVLVLGGPGRRNGRAYSGRTARGRGFMVSELQVGRLVRGRVRDAGGGERLD